MKSQIITLVLGIGFFCSNAFGYYGTNDKSGKENTKPKGANCSPAT